MWDIRSPTRGQTHTPCTGNSNPWATREVPKRLLFFALTPIQSWRGKLRNWRETGAAWVVGGGWGGSAHFLAHTSRTGWISPLSHTQEVNPPACLPPWEPVPPGDTGAEGGARVKVTQTWLASWVGKCHLGQDTSPSLTQKTSWSSWHGCYKHRPWSPAAWLGFLALSLPPCKLLNLCLLLFPHPSAAMGAQTRCICNMQWMMYGAEQGLGKCLTNK